MVRDAVLKWFVNKHWYKEDFWYTYPVVAETYDGFLNDIYGFHVKESNAWEALDSAKTGYLKEGNLGGGTGMMCLGFKGGTGTASRVVKIKDSAYGWCTGTIKFWQKKIADHRRSAGWKRVDGYPKQ